MNEILERTSTGVASGALVTPLWLPYVQAASDTAALVLPFLGATWLIIQMVSHFRKKD